MFVLDSHCDTPSQILRLRDLSLDNDHAHVDFPKLARGRVDGAFFAIYVPASLEGEKAEAYADLLMERLSATMSANQDKAAYAHTSQQAFQNKEDGLFSVFIGLENGSPLGTSLEKLQKYYGQGVRYMTLCHSADNEICDSCASAVKRWGGLSQFGREVVSTESDGGCLSVLMNLLWILCGWWELALTHLFFGLLLCITIIGIPFGLQHFKMALLSIFPFGKKIVQI